MLPEVRKLISENQKLLYTFRKGGSNLPKKEFKELCKYLGESYVTIQKRISNLKGHNVISDDFMVNPSFAYFAGFYVTDNEIEIELVDFLFEPVLDKIAQNLKTKVTYQNSADVWRIIKESIEKLSMFVPIESTCIIFNKCMSYGKNGNNIAYYLDGSKLKLYNLSLQFKVSVGLMDEVLRSVSFGDTVLAYTLYLREKLFESDSIVYYDLDENRISYIKNNILPKEENPMFGMIFPRFSDTQQELFHVLQNTTDTKYNEMLLANKNEILSAFESSYFQISSILNPEYFIFGSKWLRKTPFELFYFANNQIYAKYDEITNVLLQRCPWPKVISKHEQPQKGAGIYAAYSYFDWNLKW